MDLSKKRGRFWHATGCCVQRPPHIQFPVLRANKKRWEFLPTFFFASSRCAIGDTLDRNVRLPAFRRHGFSPVHFSVQKQYVRSAKKHAPNFDGNIYQCRCGSGVSIEKHTIFQLENREFLYASRLASMGQNGIIAAIYEMVFPPFHRIFHERFFLWSIFCQSALPCSQALC